MKLECPDYRWHWIQGIPVNSNKTPKGSREAYVRLTQPIFSTKHTNTILQISIYLYLLFKKKLCGDKLPFWGATGTLVADFGWLCPWVSSPALCSHLCIMTLAPILHLGMVRPSPEWFKPKTLQPKAKCFSDCMSYPSWHLTYILTYLLTDRLGFAVDIFLWKIILMQY